MSFNAPVLAQTAFRLALLYSKPWSRQSQSLDGVIFQLLTILYNRPAAPRVSRFRSSCTKAAKGWSNIFVTPQISGALGTMLSLLSGSDILILSGREAGFSVSAILSHIV
ncbi:hypothetical protein GOODEAATRI_002421 [Goodea atripinnis]|uniref:Uncharacterized protein n=1 Tax=Goodea atripinnis TaxID=208336 RepID=A0ABV0PKD9_9TELE